MAYTVRYYPLPFRREFVERSPVIRGFNATQPTHRNITFNASSPATIQPDYFMVEALAILIMLVLVIIIMEAYYRSPPPRPARIWIGGGGRGGIHGYPSITYDYNGVKAVLRKYYLLLRRRLGCWNCTPRELSGRNGGEHTSMFARVYEEVVYGNKMGRGLDRVLLSIKRWLGNE